MGLKPGTSFVCSWSGGKDSCLALYRAIRLGAEPMALLTMLREDGERSRSHGLPLAILRAQAAALNIPLVTRATSWNEYESTFIDALQALRATGIAAAVFGDIDLEDHRLWEEKVCAQAGLDPYLPLWQHSRIALVKEFLSLGFKATIVATHDEKLGCDFLGKVLDIELVRRFGRMGVDPCGEKGEYHTFVYDGPLFKNQVDFCAANQVKHTGHHFLLLEV